MRNRKRVLSLVLVLVMLLSLAPASALAADTEQKVKVECNVPTASVKVYSASDPETEIGCHGDGFYRLLPGEYFYTATEDIGGYDPVGRTPFTVTDGGDNTVTVTMTKAAAEDAGRNSSGDSTSDVSGGNPSGGSSGTEGGQESAVTGGIFNAHYGRHQVFSSWNIPAYPTGTQEKPDRFTVSDLAAPFNLVLGEKDYFYFMPVGPSGVAPAAGWNASADMKPYAVELRLVRSTEDGEEVTKIGRGVIGALSAEGFLFETGGETAWFSNGKGYPCSAPFCATSITYTPVANGRLVCDVKLLTGCAAESMVGASAVHEHVWNVAVEDGTAVYTCSAEGCPFGTDVKYYMSLSVPTGSGAKAAVETWSDGEGEWPAVLEQDVVYYSGRGETQYTKSMLPPTAEGTYTAEASVGYRLNTALLKVDYAIGVEEAAKEEAAEAEETEEEEALPDLFFEGEAGGVHVAVTAPAEAFPEGTVMVVEPVYNTDVLKAIEGAVEDKVVSVQAVDITFYFEGQEIEPAAPISVQLTSDAIADAEQASVVHVEDTGRAAVVEETVQEDNSISFDADSFSVYGIVGTVTVIIEDITAGVDYTVEVTASVPSTAFDKPVKLAVKAFAEASDEYKETQIALTENGNVYDGFMAFDIGFVDENDNAVEPKLDEGESISVSLKLLESALAELPADLDAGSLKMYHIAGGMELVADAGWQSSGTLNAVKETVEPAAGNQKAASSEAAESETLITALTADFAVSSFSTFVITWTEGEDEKSATIHWGIDKEDGFEELKTPTTIDSTASSVDINIIIDAEQYYFIGADYKLTEDAEEFENLESTVLHKVDGAWQIELEDSGTVNVADGSHIYVHYAPYGEGGYNPPSPPGPDVLAPETEKTVTDNEDGTYTIRLDIEGKSDHSTVQKGANVIVVMDITQSMTNNMSGGGTRMAAAKNALNILIETLNPDKNLINFRAINFGDNRNYYEGVAWTTETSAMQGYVTGLPNTPTDMGTCWQAGLRGGYQLATAAAADAVLGENETYVLFVTDGNPNCYAQNNDGTGTWTGASGPNYNATAYNRAAYWANLLGPACNFYGIFCGASGDQQYLRNLVNAANGSTANYVDGTSRDAIESAFASIAQTIVNNLGAGEVTVDDGIPTLSNVSANVSAGEAGGFKYYIKPAGGEETEWIEKATGEDDKGAPGASYSQTNGVTWDLGEAGELQNGWIYSLEFTVWPSQAAYDLIADLNNGLKEFDDLTEEQQASVEGNKTDGYTLKTNTHLYTTFKDLDGNEYREVNDATPKAMALPAPTISVEKIWHNWLDSHNEDDIKGLQMVLTRDEEEYLEFDVSSPTWKKDGIYISVGQIVGGEIKETGHDYYITEKGKESLDNTEYWEVNSPVYHPMVVDGDMKLFVQDDEASSPAFEFNGHKYVASDDTSNELRAINERVSWLNLTKVVTGSGAPADTLFNYEITITEPVKEGGTAPTIFFSVFGDTSYMSGVTTSATPWVEESTGRTYYYVANGDTFTLSIKAGWSVRFLNLATETSYSIEEVKDELAPGFAFDSAKSVETLYVGRNGSERVIADGYPQTSTFNTTTVSGTINQTNTDYTVTYTNKYELTDVKVTKVWDDGSNQDGTRPDTLTLTLNNVPTSTTTPTPEIVKDGNNWTYTWKGVPKYDKGEEIAYTITETIPEGYTADPENGTVDAGKTITNRYVPATTEVLVEKVWVDNNNQDEQRPDSVIVKLTGTVTPEGAEPKTVKSETVTLPYEGDWNYHWEGLPVKNGGLEITYTVAEDPVPEGYISEVEETSVESLPMFLIYNTPVTEVTVKKEWNDGENRDNKRPASVTVQLAADGEPVGDPVTLNKDNNWSATVGNLPKYKTGDTGDALIAYTWTEDETGLPEGYSLTSSVVDDTGLVTTITNSYTPEETEATVKKVWDDEDDTDGKRPESLTVTLSNGTETVATVTLDKDNQWTDTVDKLPKNAGGKEIAYTWTETNLPSDYTLTGTDKNGTVTTLTNTHKPGTVNVSVEKVWDDADDRDGIRPASVQVQLTKNGEAEGDPVTLNERNGWKYTWTDLIEKADGQTIAYAVDEVEVPDEYTKTVSNSGTSFTITNQHTPMTSATLDPPVQKKVENKKGTAPKDSVFTFSMTPADKNAPMPDNKEARKGSNGALYMDQKGAGSYEFGVMTFERKDVGKTYVYTVKEEPGSDGNFKYDTEIYTLTVVVSSEDNKVVIDVTYADKSGAAVDQAVFTNVYKAPDAPGTGDSTQWLAWLAALVLSGATLLTDTMLRRKKNRSGRRGS